MTVSTSLFFEYPLTRGFWDLASSSKRNTLTDRHHTPLILEALTDVETRIEQYDRDTFAIYDEECSLLIQAQNPTVVTLLTLFSFIPHYTN